MIRIQQQVTLGNEHQWYMARGESLELPLLLFLHGGPGSPQAGAQHRYNRELEKYFIVVNWDQRGSGKSYHRHIDPATMNVEQLLSDATELVQHLLRRFEKRKLYVMGHSMGALLGMQFIKRNPDVVAAYVGINQPVHRAEEEERTQQFVIAESRRRNHRKAIREMEAMRPVINGSFATMKDLVKQRTWLTKFGGVTYKKQAVWFNLSCLFSSHLTWTERLRFMKGFAFSNQCLWNELNRMNLLEDVLEVEVPVYFIMGRHDRIVHDTIQHYIQLLSAPKKELIVFEQSGHFACFEEAERFNQVMIDIAARRR